MCLECDGYSHDAALHALDLRIRVHGWTLLQVGDESSAFTYTVGLLESYGHPELIILDVKRGLQVELLTRLASSIATTGRMSDVVTTLERLRFVEVHSSQMQPNHFAMWAERYGHLPAAGDVLQVLLPDDAFCGQHVGAVTRLDRPRLTPSPFGHPNRAQRRQRKRRGNAA